MEKKDKILISIFIIIAVIVIGFVVPQEYPVSNSSPGRSTSIPPIGDQNSNNTILLLKKSMNTNDTFCYNFTVKQNITSISVECWDNGTKTIDWCLINPQGRLEDSAGDSPGGIGITQYFAQAMGEKYIAEGTWKVSLLSSSPINGTVVIYGTFN